MICARRVFKCFKTLERWGNVVTGAAGPYFVALAVILISMGTFCFFDVIAPNLSYPYISIPICILIALNLFMHYFYVVTVKPGFIGEPPVEPGTSFLWAQKPGKGKQKALTGGVRWTSKGVRITPAGYTKCVKCASTRPERAHHCRICNKCVLKYDHHCPVRINQCVGLHNERHFVMFMAYLVLSTFCLCISGYPYFFESLGVTYIPWDHHVPEIMFAMIFILSVVLCFAVGVMLGYHLYNISWGETSVEAQDHEEYRRKAKIRNESFVNSYDLGKRKNLLFFFNIGEGGYSIITLFIPFRINPYTDGYSWARQEGLERHQGMRQGEELTDDENEDDV
ncbi:zf-DHHC-domain-containing protein [Pholiota conissans]|uniref:Palmitoyltransferase n=1 Tax=Pholiota conissans TaxID=109636 RepID=A0A9P6CUI5_9AGAR|nr:zf-DHHC-domain-containing protein [Pholiota conissans]